MKDDPTQLPPQFPDLRDRRISDMSIPEQDNAMEDWLRANHRYFRDDSAVHIRFLLMRLEAVRDLQRVAERAIDLIEKTERNETDFFRWTNCWTRLKGLIVEYRVKQLAWEKRGHGA